MLISYNINVVLQIDLTNLQAAFVALNAMKINSPFKSSHNADF